MVALAAAAGWAQAVPEVPGWRGVATPHLWLYVVDGTPGARDASAVAAALDPLVARLSEALGRPARVVYPLYPSVDAFRADWWRFATPPAADAVHGWGAVYRGDPADLSVHLLARSLAAAALGDAIPLLRWGVAEALGDRAVGADPHAHVAALRAAGQPLPAVARILSPVEFGHALPWSYPVAVSFVADLIDRYGARRTAQFARAVGYRYVDLPEIFRDAFGTSLDDAVAAWEERVRRAPAPAVDPHAYALAARLVYGVGLARPPAAVMLEPAGADVVVAAAKAAAALRRLDVPAAAALAEAAHRTQAEARARQALRRTVARGLPAAVAAVPVALALLWLVWPAVRSRLADRRAAPPAARAGRSAR
ncbi:MAG: hypothetical protein QN173_10395 [Armatimonadota bacterium]|nr:hypothetical protein [Armatimonadota bacterium]MDR7471542.1 hypothetical protein [Armatimonadota bacterium]MDR7508001.1 hypothetical protein [Armatimonadota bacterium]MDR7509600.1 hypothetical protein [Armatimonadota bacterium]MDR7516446.1 hypothetical protein [Armatimonadota bacterium]